MSKNFGARLMGTSAIENQTMRRAVESTVGSTTGSMRMPARA